MKSPTVSEILAPVGGPQALEAAVRCGANAVYFGAGGFNARRSAENFSENSLGDAIALCRSRGVKVYFTLNTLVSDSELAPALRLARQVCELGADALILQDIGLSRLVARAAPDMPLHASTQMSVQSAAGLRELEEMGFTRAVLPRELSMEDIFALAGETSLELEMFVHGALCMSVSGQCEMSALFGSRSGNRGLCAQPCRLDFCSGDVHNALSLKDLSLLEYLPELARAGVTSFKIEGRMKRPEYVAAAVTACREALAGGVSSETGDALRRVFSRSGFTDGYYTGKVGREMLGVRLHEDVTSASGVLKKLASLYEKERPAVPVSFFFECQSDEPLVLKATSGDFSAVSNAPAAERAVNRETSAHDVESSLSKCGGTQFFVQNTEIRLAEGMKLPLSLLNRMRREVLEELDRQLSEPIPKKFRETESFVPDSRKTAAKPLKYFRLSRASQLSEKLIGMADRIILPLSSAPSLFNELSLRTEVAVEIPAGMAGLEQKNAARLSAAREAGVKTAVFATLDGLRLAKEAKMRASAGVGTNIFNRRSLAEYQSLGVCDALLSFELTLSQAAGMAGILPQGLLVYGRLPLMLCRNCPLKHSKSCSECGGKGKISDRMGIEFPVECGEKYIRVLNSRPLWMADRKDELHGMDFYWFYFTDESSEECVRAVEAFEGGDAARGEFTRGLYYKGVK